MLSFFNQQDYRKAPNFFPCGGFSGIPNCANFSLYIYPLRPYKLTHLEIETHSNTDYCEKSKQRINMM